MKDLTLGLVGSQQQSGGARGLQPPVPDEFPQLQAKQAPGGGGLHPRWLLGPEADTEPEAGGGARLVTHALLDIQPALGKKALLS